MERLSTMGVRLAESLSDVQDDVFDQISVIWGQVKTPFVVPFLKTVLYICLAMATMVFLEGIYMSLVVVFMSLFRKKAEKRYKWEAFEEDTELGSSVYPMVLVQVPMFNEKEVYQLSIGAVCRLSWPNDRIVIQVLDDSTDPLIKDLVEMECKKWARNGKNIHYQLRDNRNGYKAGALKEGLKHSYAKECQYVAIFDADFQPEPDFLSRSIPFLHHNEELGLVQTSWKFANSNECLMTRMQEMSLNYHFKMEQESGSSTFAFFGFNGTAGVWRMATINEAGGWQDRTTVEDMDLAVRASLHAWKFLYLGSIKVQSELPSTLKAYRYQQHRWSCGSANLFRKMVIGIIRNKKVTLWKKLYVIYNFFFIRKIVAHVVTFVFFCVILPIIAMVHEIEIPSWGTFYIPTIITLLNLVATPRSFYLVVFWILFENVMSLHRTKAIFIGLFETGRVNEWVVTEKLGDASKAKVATIELEKPRSKIGERLLLSELGMAVFLVACGSYNLAFGKYRYYIYIYLQAIAFFIVGIGYVGTQVPTS